MAKGSSQSQTSSSAGGTARPAMVGLRGTPAAAMGMRRRRLGGGGGGFAGGGYGGMGGGSNMLRFYTDDAPGLKMTPTVVLVMSLCFIGFVTALLVFGKLYRSFGSCAEETTVAVERERRRRGNQAMAAAENGV